MQLWTSKYPHCVALDLPYKVDYLVGTKFPQGQEIQPCQHRSNKLQQALKSPTRHLQHGECSYVHNNTPTAQPLTSPPRLITLSEQNSHRVRRYSLVRRDPTSSDKVKKCRQGLCRTGSAAMTMRPTSPGSSRRPNHDLIPCRSRRPSGSGDKALSVPSDKNGTYRSRIIVLGLREYLLCTESVLT